MKKLIAVCVLLLAGCAAVPKAAPVEQDNGPISIIKLVACDKPYAFFVVARDGTIHFAAASQLSKDQIIGVEAQAAKLPDDSAGQLTIPCVPTLDTSL